MGQAASLRFLSPLIEPGVRISRIRLSDFLLKVEVSLWHKSGPSLMRGFAAGVGSKADTGAAALTERIV